MGRMGKTALLCLLVALFASSSVLRAQFQMPDPKEMSGIPRPVTDLPNGSVSVRLIRGQLSNNLTNHPVELHAGSKVTTVKTDENGRAQFDALAPGTAVKAVAVVDGERLDSKRAYGERPQCERTHRDCRHACRRPGDRLEVKARVGKRLAVTGVTAEPARAPRRKASGRTVTSVTGLPLSTPS